VRLYVWTPPDGRPAEIGRLAQGCLDPNNRTSYYDLAIGGEHVYWGEKTAGLSYNWSLHAQTLTAGNSVMLTGGRGTLGCPYCDGAGALAAAGDLAVFGEWHTVNDAASGQRVTTENLLRVTATGCPCTPLVYAAAPFTTAPLVPLDTDGTRIAALRYGSLVVLDSSGHDLLTSSIAAGGAQITGDALVVLVEGQLNQYDIATGAFRRTYAVPGGAAGRHCDFYSEPHCPTTALVRLQDASNGLVAYIVNGQLHVLHLATGADDTVGYASAAAFTATGIAFADGARINFLSYARLGGKPATGLQGSGGDPQPGRLQLRSKGRLHGSALPRLVGLYRWQAHE
jgi:hypothetical protein